MIDTSTEHHRHRCEVRHCIRMGAEWFTEYIKAVSKARGKPAAQLLFDDVRAQSRRGNVGAPGNWRQAE